MKKINVILSDDHNIIREGLASVLQKHPDIKVIAQAGDGRVTVQLTKELMPDVVVMDVTMPGLNGIEATRQIMSACSNVKVIALSIHSSKQFVMEMLRAGASGYLLKDCASDDLAYAIRSVANGQNYLSPQIARTVIKNYIDDIETIKNSVFSILTHREREVLQLLSEGKSTKQIASILSLSIKTIETHRQHITKKLNINNIAELTKYAIREGLTPL
ncbi:DNA-binding response regulator [Dissulfurispira thermophila]|uniref:DNA-binding response regulator n=2 Tax=root TaxID=1 RepID=A0A7G1H2K7_9BACT|nr:response regulator transcription factor [Dissulfurispira thermophila]BCB96898.1 DNA-binding response regulator [Dissulfurispira thermophila]